MQWLTEFFRRVRYFLRRPDFDRDLAEEMRLHLDLRAEEAASAGAPPLDAYASAKRRFGNALRVREDSREAWGWLFIDTLAQDIRYGLRALAADPGFTAAAVLSLALGIGANTAIFSIVNAVMLRALPVEDPSRLVQVSAGSGATFTNPIWEYLRDHQRAFSGTLAYSSDRLDLSSGGESHFAQGLWVSGDYFRVLGVAPLLGRFFTRDNDVPGGGSSGAVAVISYAFWQGHFAGDPAILGKSIHLDRHEFQIVGVTPPWFKGLDVDQSYDVAVPIGCEPLLHTDQSALKNRSWWWLRIVGRLPPDETIQRANAGMNSIAPDLFRNTVSADWRGNERKEFLRQTFTLQPATTGFSGTGRRYRTALFTLMTVVGLVLLIACANVANLLLARATARQREIAIRLAIGAGRFRVVRQLLTESLLLALLGALGGFLFSLWGSRLLLRLLSTSGEPLQIDLSPDLHLLAFTVAVSALTGILFGLAPALRATSVPANQVLKEHSRGTLPGASRFTVGKALVTAQVALSLMLLVGAGLFLGTFRNLLTIDPGFDRGNVLLVSAVVPEARLAKPLRTALFAKILDGLRNLPGVQSAAASMRTPITHWIWNENTYPEGYQREHGEEDTLLYLNGISPAYFATLGTPLLMGRDFSARDNVSSPKVMVISESAARHFWGSANPLGKTVGMDGPGPPGKQDLYQVIAIAKDAKYADLNENPVMTAYVPFWQDADPRPSANYEIRYRGSLQTLTPAVRNVLMAANKDITLEFRTLETQVDDSLMQQRLVALLSSFFGFLALLLAMVGLYGVISYSVAKRRGEIGIRMALGAQHNSVIWLVLRDVLLVLAIGTAVGAAASVASARLVASLLFGVRPTDPFTVVLAAIVLCSAASLAGYLPARRASKMDPMAALRDE